MDQTLPWGWVKSVSQKNKKSIKNERPSEILIHNEKHVKSDLMETKYKELRDDSAYAVLFIQHWLLDLFKRIIIVAVFHRKIRTLTEPAVFKTVFYQNIDIHFCVDGAIK